MKRGKKIDKLKFFDKEKILKCDKNGCSLITPLSKLEMRKVKGGYILNIKKNDF